MGQMGQMIAKNLNAFKNKVKKSEIENCPCMLYKSYIKNM